MWLLNFLPFWVVHLIVLVGGIGLVASLVLGAIPFVKQYKLPIQIASFVIFVFGVYLEGGTANQEMWEARIKEMEAKVALAEEKAKNANSKIEYKFIDKVQVVRDTQVVIQKEIEKVATVIDAQCKLTPEAIDLLNAAAKNTKPGEKQ